MQLLEVDIVRILVVLLVVVPVEKHTTPVFGDSSHRGREQGVVAARLLSEAQFPDVPVRLTYLRDMRIRVIHVYTKSLNSLLPQLLR